jgi:hypothetical protein
MTPFHSLLPELAQREVRCVHLGAATETTPEPALPADEYIYMEFYCEDLNCDCRRVFLQVIAKGQPGKVFASLSYGWEKESFYRKRMPWDPDEAKGTVRGELDPLNEQSEFAEDFLDLFQRVVLDQPSKCHLEGLTFARPYGLSNPFLVPVHMAVTVRKGTLRL